MKLQDLILNRESLPGSEKIPWDDPEFSRRMLASHLDQEHDWASRRESIIDTHVGYIHNCLKHKPSAILDLACGPGLYASRLADLGHQCVGVDFSPASINHARERATNGDQELCYIQGDICRFESGRKFDCAIFIFGEFNVFREEEARNILSRVAAALRPGGLFLLETHTLDAVREAGLAAPSWERREKGLFSDGPHLFLRENAWNEKESRARTRYSIVEPSGEVRCYGSVMQGYDNSRLAAMLAESGFTLLPGPGSRKWPTGRDFEGRMKVWRCRLENSSH